MNEITLVELWLKSSTDKYILYLVLGVVLGVNIVLTLVHFVQELKGLQWRYLGAIAGLQIPDGKGIWMFFVVPLFALVVLGLAGIIRLFGSASPGAAMACVAALIGTRLSDSIFIHIRPNRQGYCPNPALGTIPYYLAEAAILTVLFFPGLGSHYIYAAVGFTGGFAFFFSVLPGLKAVRTFRHVEPWQSETPIPSWAKLGNEETLRADKL